MKGVQIHKALRAQCGTGKVLSALTIIIFIKYPLHNCMGKVLFTYNGKDGQLIQSRQFSGAETNILITCLVELTRPNRSNELEDKLVCLA